VLPYLYDLVLWFLVLNLHNKFYPTLTGGDFLLNQLLFFNCFISGNHEVKKSVFNEIRICLHNLGAIAIITQICFVYFVSGITKLMDETWMSGSAVSMVSQVDHFSLYSHFRFSKDSALANLLTYVVMFYQLLFPVLIWFSKIKKPLIIFGIIIHLYIALGMGLFTFGLVMLIGYIFFWPYAKSS
jgi:hypothetical protein